MSLKRREKHGDQCLESLAANAIGRFPQHDENLAHGLVVKSQSR